MSVESVAILVAVAVLVIVAMFLMPAIASVKKSAESIASLADLLQNDLKPTIKELNQILSDLSVVGSSVAEHSDDVKKFMTALGDTGSQLNNINRSVGAVTGMFGQVEAISVGVKSAGSYLLDNMFKRKRKE